MTTFRRSSILGRIDATAFFKHGILDVAHRRPDRRWRSGRHHRRHLQQTQGHRRHRREGVRHPHRFRHQAFKRTGRVAGEADPAPGGSAAKILRARRIHEAAVPLVATVLRDRRARFPQAASEAAPAGRAARRRGAGDRGGLMTFVIAWIGLAALVLLFNRGAHM